MITQAQLLMLETSKTGYILIIELSSNDNNKEERRS